MTEEYSVPRLDGCQIPCLPRLTSAMAEFEPAGWKVTVKRNLARPWNQHAKPRMKAFYRWVEKVGLTQSATNFGETEILNEKTTPPLVAGDWVRVKSLEEIQATLDRWRELKGCAFLENMTQYCGTDQQVLRQLERFLDERDYKVKKCRGVVLLKNVICTGTPVFGRCDRSCFLFWRVEWLQRIPTPETTI
jgi:hypothetical protein